MMIFVSPSNVLHSLTYYTPLWPFCRLNLQQKWVPGIFPGG